MQKFIFNGRDKPIYGLYEVDNGVSTLIFENEDFTVLQGFAETYAEEYPFAAFEVRAEDGFVLYQITVSKTVYAVDNSKEYFEGNGYE